MDSSLNSLKSHRKVEMIVHTSGLLKSQRRQHTLSKLLRRVPGVVNIQNVIQFKCNVTLLFVEKKF